MRLKPQTAIALSIVFVVAGIAVTWAAGLFQTESDKTPRKLETEHAAQALEQQYDPADIRGSYTFGEISELYGIPIADLAAAFLLKDEEAYSFQVKSLAKHFPDAEKEIGTSSVRLFAACYLSVGYAPKEDSYLPQEAVDILKKAGRMTNEQAAYVGSHTLSIAGPKID
jgi:hypothetical protein